MLLLLAFQATISESGEQKGIDFRVTKLTTQYRGVRTDISEQSKCLFGISTPFMPQDSTLTY